MKSSTVFPAVPLCPKVGRVARGDRWSWISSFPGRARKAEWSRIASSDSDQRLVAARCVFLHLVASGVRNVWSAARFSSLGSFQ